MRASERTSKQSSDHPHSTHAFHGRRQPIQNNAQSIIGLSSCRVQAKQNASLPRLVFVVIIGYQVDSEQLLRQRNVGTTCALKDDKETERDLAGAGISSAGLALRHAALLHIPPERLAGYLHLLSSGNALESVDSCM